METQKYGMYMLSSCPHALSTGQYTVDIHGYGIVVIYHSIY